MEKLWHQLGIAFARRGHLVTQISRLVPELPASETLDGVHHLRVPGYDQPPGMLALKWRDLCYTRRALRVAPPADILVTNTFWAPLLAPRKLGQIHVSVERMPKGQMRLYRRAARLRACSQAVGDGIKGEAPSLSDRVIVIPNPLPFVPDRSVENRTNSEQILYVGRIHPVKGVELLQPTPAVAAAVKLGGATPSPNMIEPTSSGWALFTILLSSMPNTALPPCSHTPPSTKPARLCLSPPLKPWHGAAFPSSLI